MPRTHTLCCLALTLALTSPALADTDWLRFPEFRHVSSMPGNGFGVDAEGRVGFGGALNMNVPCAYTPASGNYVAGYHSSSTGSDIKLGFGGDEVDGTLFVGAGFYAPGSGIYVSEIFTEEHLGVNTWNAQLQIADETRDCPAIAVGCIDLQNRRPGIAGGLHGARSIYVAASKQLAAGALPLYLTVGYGGGRFDHDLFGAISWYPGPNLNVGLEHDGMITTPHATWRFLTRDRWEASASLSWGDFDRPDVGITVTRSR